MTRLSSGGRIEVICGCMFSGKTEELIRRLRRARIARQKVQVFKPAIDNRYHVEKVTSHSGSEFDATPVASAAEVLSRLAADTTVVGLDEAQFFDAAVLAVCRTLAIAPSVLSNHWSPKMRKATFGPSVTSAWSAPLFPGVKVVITNGLRFSEMPVRVR